MVDQLLEAFPKQVKYVYKVFPLTSIHRFALGAAKAALAAQKQGKFWEMHDKLFANQRALQPENLDKYAQEIGLNMEQFKKDMNSPEIQQEVNDSVKLARQSAVRGTPTLFVNGKRVTNRSLPGLKAMIDAALKEKKAA